MFTEVTPNLYRSGRPQDLLTINALGIKQIINLQSGIYEFWRDDAYELGLVRDCSLIYREIDCFALFPPSPAAVELAHSFIEAGEALGHKTLIHCKAGVDRTGFVIAAYRMQKQGWSYKEAVAEVIRMGQHRRYRWWNLFLKQYEVKK